MAAKKPNPQVVAARQTARQTAKSQGLGPRQVQQAGRQAARSTRYGLNNPLPQPPAPPADGGGGGQGGYYQYSPTAESQINQPYQDLEAAGAYGALGGALGRMPQQSQMSDIYGQGAAGNLGGAQGQWGQLGALGGQATGLGAGSLGQYGQLMGGNLGIQQGLANEIQGIQQGNLEVDPATEQLLGQQQRDFETQMQRQLGPDWRTSSAGIEAQGRMTQGANTLRGSQNYNRLLSLINAQQGGMGNIANAGLGLGGYALGTQGQQFGQGAQLGNMLGQNNMDLFNQMQNLRGGQLSGATSMLNNLGQIQSLYGNIPGTMGQFGGAMSGQSGAAVNAQGPYQQDRITQLGTQYAPTSGQFLGQMMGQSGNRWINVGQGMVGGGSPQNTGGSSFTGQDYGTGGMANVGSQMYYPS